MKKNFEGVSSKEIPAGWDDSVSGNPWMKAEVLTDLKNAGCEVSLIVHKDYVCCEYRMKLNILTFSRLTLSLPFWVVGLPVSVSGSGFCGDLDAMIRDYRKRKGLILLLNLESTEGIPSDIACGRTLPTCVFDNRYGSFEEYLSCLKSAYRRRVVAALSKGKPLEIRRIDGLEFTAEMYGLYLNVLQRSKYPLETLDIGFFRHFDAQIHVLYDNGTPLAFVMTKRFGIRLHFLFGGMDYTARDRFDLYYNMLLTVIRIGIEEKVSQIDFGQTAEGVKCRIGCRIHPKYMCAFAGNRLINRLFGLFSGYLEYNDILEECRALKEQPVSGIEK
ncbi:MAG: GNAT family N-acetyltransferase [Saccharofermentanales bacterium]